MKGPQSYEEDIMGVGMDTVLCGAWGPHDQWTLVYQQMETELNSYTPISPLILDIMKR